MKWVKVKSHKRSRSKVKVTINVKVKAGGLAPMSSCFILGKFVRDFQGIQSVEYSTLSKLVGDIS